MDNACFCGCAAGLRLHADVSCRAVRVPGNADTIINQSVFNATQRWGLRMAAALNESYGMPPPCTIGEGARPGLGEYFFCRAPNATPRLLSIEHSIAHTLVLELLHLILSSTWRGALAAALLSH